MLERFLSGSDHFGQFVLEHFVYYRRGGIVC
jgi:hypothetical protein